MCKLKAIRMNSKIGKLARNVVEIEICFMMSGVKVTVLLSIKKIVLFARSQLSRTHIVLKAILKTIIRILV